VSATDGYRSYVIVNPTSAAGATGRHWQRIAHLLRQSLGDFEHALTTSANEATTLTQAALGAGFEMIVAVGGDGTVNEIVQGFFQDRIPIAPDAVLGVIAVGTGSDFGRTIGQTDLESACARLAGRNTRRIDAGLVRFTGHDGTAMTRVFINVASFGVSGLVVHYVNPRLKKLSGRVAFTLATLRALATYRDQTVSLQFDDAPPFSGKITNCAFGNGRFFGAGMQVAPAAELDDGALDVTVWSGFTLLDFIRKLPKLYDGSHVRERGSKTMRVRRASASSGARMLVEIDGESAGVLPLTVEVLPAALLLKV
jgi:YegS/Rv2252/BmrU family lipid kinase